MCLVFVEQPQTSGLKAVIILYSTLIGGPSAVCPECGHSGHQFTGHIMQLTG